MFGVVALVASWLLLGAPCLWGIISYALLESAIRPGIQPKSSISHEGEPSGIWMTEGG